MISVYTWFSFLGAISEESAEKYKYEAEDAKPSRKSKIDPDELYRAQKGGRTVAAILFLFVLILFILIVLGLLAYSLANIYYFY